MKISAHQLRYCKINKLNNQSRRVIKFKINLKINLNLHKILKQTKKAILKLQKIIALYLLNKIES